MRVIGLAGWSGAGKTTLIERLIPHFVARGVRVSTIKHAHHEFDVDVPGKDSWRHRQAGANEVIISSTRRVALIRELRDLPEPPLPDLLQRLLPVDLVVIEGFRHAAHRKVEVHRIANAKPLLFPDDPDIVGVAADSEIETHLPLVALDDIVAIADLMLATAAPVTS